MEMVRDPAKLARAVQQMQQATCLVPEGKTNPLVPVNEPNHWWLMQVDLVSRNITACDSNRNGGNNYSAYHTTAIDMLIKVLQMATTQPQWTRTLTSDSYPRQDDGINCGVYVLRAISMFLRGNDPLLAFSAKRPDCTRW